MNFEHTGGVLFNCGQIWRLTVMCSCWIHKGREIRDHNHLIWRMVSKTWSRIAILSPNHEMDWSDILFSISVILFESDEGSILATSHTSGLQFSSRWYPMGKRWQGSNISLFQIITLFPPTVKRYCSVPWLFKSLNGTRWMMWILMGISKTSQNLL